MGLLHGTRGLPGANPRTRLSTLISLEGNLLSPCKAALAFHLQDKNWTPSM